MLLIQGYTDADKVPGGVAQNVFGAGRISIGAILLQCVLFGNMGSAGTATANVKVPVTTPEEADTLFGAGYELNRMCAASLDVPGVTLYAIPVTEASGAAATATIRVLGSFSTAGEITVQLDEESFRVSFASSDNTTLLAAGVVEDAVNGRQNGRLFCTAAATAQIAANTAVTQSGPVGPTVTLSGTTTTAYDGTYRIEIDLGGIVSVATFKWYLNDVLQASGVVTAASVVLGSTGITANFTAGTHVLTTVHTWFSNAAAGLVTLTVRSVGIRGNQHTLFKVDESLRPSGMIVKVAGGTALSNGGVPFTGGTGTDDVTAALAAVASVQNDYEAFAQNDAANMALVETATNNKAAYDVGLLQQYVTSTNTNLAGAIAIGQTQMNDVLGVCAWVQYGVEHPSRVSARLAGLFSITDGDQPNTNYDDVILPGAASQFRAADSPSRATKNAALNASVLPFYSVNGDLKIVRAINSHSLNGSTPDYRTYDHSETTVPLRIRKELLALYDEVKTANPFAGPDTEDGMPPVGTFTPRFWASEVTAQLQNWASDAFNWLTDVEENPVQAEWNSTAKRVMSLVPTVVKAQNHACGIIVRQQAA